MAENQTDKLRIKVHLYDTDLSVMVQRSEEEYYRKAAKLITDTVNSYAAKFKAQKSDKELLYMALLDIALRYVREKDTNDPTPIYDILTKLTGEIEEVLK